MCVWVLVKVTFWESFGSPFFLEIVLKDPYRELDETQTNLVLEFAAKEMTKALWKYAKEAGMTFTDPDTGGEVIGNAFLNDSMMTLVLNAYFFQIESCANTTPATIRKKIANIGAGFEAMLKDSIKEAT